MLKEQIIRSKYIWNSNNSPSKEIIEKRSLTEASKKINIPEALIQDILEKLTQFEKDKGYLNAYIDLSTLAKSLGTNHAYLSRVVNHVKNKSFKKYLNDLRLEHAFVELQTNPLKRQYTIEAIALDNGFRSAESFSKKFRSHYGTYPSVFLKRFKESA